MLNRKKFTGLLLLAMAYLYFLPVPHATWATEPICGRGDILLCEDFEDWQQSVVDNCGSPCYGWTWNSGWNSRVYVDSGAYQSNKSFRATFPPEEWNSPFPEHSISPQQAGDTTYARFYYKVSSNYLFNEGEQKVFLLTSRGGTNWEVQIDLTANNPEHTQGRFLVETMNHRIRMQISSQNTVERNQWYCLELMVNPNTPGSDDGNVKLWIDGVLKIDIDEADFRTDTHNWCVWHDSTWTGQGYDDGFFPYKIPGCYWNPPCSTCSDHLITNSTTALNDILVTSYGPDLPHPETEWVWYDQFVISTNYVGPVQTGPEPTSPSLRSPADGDTVIGTKPILTINNSFDADPLTYEFQVFGDSGLTQLATSASNLAEGSDSTSWRVDLDLIDTTHYWWRARAFDGQYYSNWMNTASFFVSSTGTGVKPPPGDSTQIAGLYNPYVFPNPFKPSEGANVINFVDLPPAAEIKIATLSGDLVYKVKLGPSDSQWVWDVKNRDGKELASGVYLYSISYPGGSTSGKLAVIK